MSAMRLYGWSMRMTTEPAGNDVSLLLVDLPLSSLTFSTAFMAPLARCDLDALDAQRVQQVGDAGLARLVARESRRPRVLPSRGFSTLRRLFR